MLSVWACRGHRSNWAFWVLTVHRLSHPRLLKRKQSLHSFSYSCVNSFREEFLSAKTPCQTHEKPQKVGCQRGRGSQAWKGLPSSLQFSSWGPFSQFPDGGRENSCLTLWEWRWAASLSSPISTGPTVPTRTPP